MIELVFSRDDNDERDEYDKHMDELAKRVSDVLEGEQTSEVIFVCIALAAYAMSQLSVKEKKTVYPKVLDLFNEVLND